MSAANLEPTGEMREITPGSDAFRQERALREAVLRRPLGLTLEEPASEDAWRHFGWFDAEGTLTACVVAVPIDAETMRLRQMAVEPAWQGRGIGARLLRAVEAGLAADGVRRLTLHARCSAAGFYQRLGYAATGPEFVEVGIPHVPMARALEPELLIVPMTPAHSDAARALWERTPGIAVRDADSREATARYLARNPGLSFVALVGDELVGTALAGHDGRRGYLQHVVVDPRFRRRGLGRELVARCLAALRAEGIARTHLFVFRDNPDAITWWQRGGWCPRDEIAFLSFTPPDAPNA